MKLVFFSFQFPCRYQCYHSLLSLGATPPVLLSRPDGQHRTASYYRTNGQPLAPEAAEGIFTKSPYSTVPVSQTSQQIPQCSNGLDSNSYITCSTYSGSPLLFLVQEALLSIFPKNRSALCDLEFIRESTIWVVQPVK